jgi:hypothetical protein
MKTTSMIPAVATLLLHVTPTLSATSAEVAKGRFESAFLYNSACSVSLAPPNYYVANYNDTPDDILLTDGRCPIYYVESGAPYFPTSQPAVLTLCPASYSTIVTIDVVGYPIMYHFPTGGKCYIDPNTDTWKYEAAGCTQILGSYYGYYGYYYTCTAGGYIVLYHPFTGVNPYANCTIGEGNVACDCPVLRTPLYSACTQDNSSTCSSNSYIGSPNTTSNGNPPGATSNRSSTTQHTARALSIACVMAALSVAF